MQENYKIPWWLDDDMFAGATERYLTGKNGVRSVANAEQMDRLPTRELFHLMVLDFTRCREDGSSICRVACGSRAIQCRSLWSRA